MRGPQHIRRILSLKTYVTIVQKISGQQYWLDRAIQRKRDLEKLED